MIENLSAIQDRRVLNTDGYLTFLDYINVPNVVRELLRYGPKHPCRSQFQEEHFLLNMDLLPERCVKEDLERDAINKTNSFTVGYIANCKRRSVGKNVNVVKDWLKDQGVSAVPYDKGTGFA